MRWGFVVAALLAAPVLSTESAANRGGKMNRIYQIGFDTQGCNYEFWINGLRADKQTSNHPIVYDLPVNLWVRSGKNEIEMKLLPISGKTKFNRRTNVRVHLLTCGPEFADGRTIGPQDCKKTEIVSYSAETTEESKLPSRLSLTGSFVSAVPEGEKFFLDELRALCPSDQEIAEQYAKLYELFRTGKKEEILKRMDFKIRHFSRAHFQSLEQEQARQENVLTDLFSKKLKPFSTEGFKVGRFGGNRLFALEDDEGDQPIFWPEDDGSTTFYPVWLGKVKGSDDWIIAF